MMELCLAAALSAARITLPDASFTLTWVHSIEKVEWQEDWRVTEHGLNLLAARVKGSGAGMEPGVDAVLRDGWYQWFPRLAPLSRLVLGRSGVVADHRLCVGGDCRPVSDYIGGSEPLVLEPCHAP